MKRLVFNLLKCIENLPLSCEDIFVCEEKTLVFNFESSKSFNDVIFKYKLIIIKNIWTSEWTGNEWNTCTTLNKRIKLQSMKKHDLYTHRSRSFHLFVTSNIKPAKEINSFYAPCSYHARKTDCVKIIALVTF